MLMATLLCLLKGLLGVSRDYVSITVSIDRRPYLDFMNQTIGSTVELHCGNQRSDLQLNSGADCRLHRWFYDPRTLELACVCKMLDENIDDRKLIQVGHSRAIFAIPEVRFVELDIVGQGSFAYELEIVTTSDDKDTVLSLFPHNTTNDIALISKKCDSFENQTNIEFCFTVHGNGEMVTWDYPENWIGPVRYLRNMAYDPITTIVQVAGIYWPKKQSGKSAPLHVDTVMLVGDSTADMCAIFFEKWLMKCRVEFIEESVINPSKFLVKLNLLMPAEMGDNPITELTNLKLAKSLKPRYGTCMFPAHMRQEAAFYVPPRAPLTGKPFEFTVIGTKRYVQRSYQQLNDEDICPRLMNLFAGIITNCTNIKSENEYFIASVQSGLTVGSVYEEQLQLMVRLNRWPRNMCSFNVVPKTISKHH